MNVLHQTQFNRDGGRGLEIVALPTINAIAEGRRKARRENRFVHRKNAAPSLRLIKLCGPTRLIITSAAPPKQCVSLIDHAAC